MFTAIIAINAINFIMAMAIIIIMAIVTVILIIVINNKVNTLIIKSITIYLLRRDPECYCPKVDLLVSLNAGEDKENACILNSLFIQKYSICILIIVGGRKVVLLILPKPSQLH